jgi:hypothetical protein
VVSPCGAEKRGKTQENAGTKQEQHAEVGISFSSSYIPLPNIIALLLNIVKIQLPLISADRNSLTFLRTVKYSCILQDTKF